MDGDKAKKYNTLNKWAGTAKDPSLTSRDKTTLLKSDLRRIEKIANRQNKLLQNTKSNVYDPSELEKSDLATNAEVNSILLKLEIIKQQSLRRGLEDDLGPEETERRIAPLTNEGNQTSFVKELRSPKK